MARKKLLAVAVGMLLPAVAQALTLNQIKVGSLLDQPLKAAIEVTAERQEELDSLRVGLASPRHFSEKGIPRPDMLEELRFQVVRKEAGKAQVIVTTSKPVKEPFLDFLVEATWDSGQVMREYTVLLDPPFTVDRSPPPIEVPAQAASPKPVAAEPAPPPKAPQQKPEAQTAAPAAPPRAPAERPPAKAAPDAAPAVPVAEAAGPVAGRIKVTEGDTLWSLAKSVRPAGASVYQTLNAIFLANPHAFRQDNVNLMLEGSILRVPPREEIMALDQGAAERLLAEHTRAWRPGTPVSSGDGAAKSPPKVVQQPAAEQKRDAAELRLASAGTGSSAARAGESGEAQGDAAATASRVDELSQQLVLAREDAAAVRQESDDLRTRLTDLQAQLEDARRLLELKDEQLARLQAYYAAQAEEQAGPETAAAAETVPEDAIAAETVDRGPVPVEPPAAEAGQQQALDRAPEADVEPAAAPVTETPGAAATAEPEEAVDAAEPVAEASPGPDEPEQEGAAEPPADAPAGTEPAATEAADEGEPGMAAAPATATTTGSRSGLEDIPVMPVLGGVAVAGLAGLFFLLRRRRRRDEIPPADAAAMPAVAPAAETAQPSVATQLAEVDDLMAVGDLAGARTISERLLVSNPGQPQVALKLFEIHRKAGDAKAYAALARKLAATGFAADYADAWTRVEEMGRELMPGDRLFAPAAPAAEAAAGEPDFDDMLDSLETELSGREKSVREEAAEALGEAATHLAAGGEPEPVHEAAASAAGQPAAPDAAAEGQADDTLEFERVGRPAAEAADAEAPAASYEGAIEFDLDSLEQSAATAETQSAAQPAGAETRVAPEDAIDTLEFTLPAGEAEAGDEVPANLGDDLAESLESFPLTSDEGQVTAEQGGEADFANIVSLHPDESPVPEEAAATDEDEVQTKLDLARAFLDLGDAEGARGILEEVVAEGNERQREEAQSLLSNTG